MGVLIAVFVMRQSVDAGSRTMMNMLGIENASRSQTHSSMSMDDMSRELKPLEGDNYDKAFIEMMIAHHQGAIDMAKLSATRAKHDEVKKLSQEVITAQEKEINDMKRWQELWGYSVDEMMREMHTNN